MLNEVIKIEPLSSMSEVLKRRGRDTGIGVQRRGCTRTHQNDYRLDAKDRHLPNFSITTLTLDLYSPEEKSFLWFLSCC